MSIPDILAERIRAGLEQVREHPRHELDLAQRDAILAAMGLRDPRATLDSHEGKRRRAVLAVLTARHVLPIWQRAWPMSDSPQTAIAAAEALLRSSADVSDPYAVIERCQVEIEQVMREDHVSACSGRSAVQALVVAVEDEFFDPAVADGETGSGAQDEYEDDDTATLASTAYAGGSASNPASDPELRQKFWEWWLTEAVPAAYAEGTIPPERSSETGSST